MARARFVVVLLLSSAVATGCVGSTGDNDARARAVEACDVLDQDFSQEFDVGVLDFVADQYGEAADAAAQAASIDEKYGDLVRGFTELEEFFLELADTVREHGDSPESWPSGTADRLVRQGERADATEIELRALCRIERAG